MTLKIVIVVILLGENRQYSSYILVVSGPYGYLDKARREEQVDRI